MKIEKTAVWNSYEGLRLIDSEELSMRTLVERLSFTNCTISMLLFAAYEVRHDKIMWAKKKKRLLIYNYQQIIEDLAAYH